MPTVRAQYTPTVHADAVPDLAHDLPFQVCANCGRLSLRRKELPQGGADFHVLVCNDCHTTWVSGSDMSDGG